MIAFTQGVMA